jgi:fatty acid desaturase/nitrite reductase/ring-hydroxylating ferredoxin subunit
MTHATEFLLGPAPVRDYRVAGPAADEARDAGLVDGQWFVPPIDPDRLRELSTRSTMRPLLDLALWAGLLMAFATVAVVVGTRAGWWWAVPLFIAYGALYGGACDARWHEFGHGTATPHARLNDAVYWVASFCALRNPTAWRWSHFRHHSDTIIVGRDPEIQIGRPGTIRRWLVGYTGIAHGFRSVAILATQAAGRLDGQTRDYVPASEVPRVVREARSMLAIHGLVIGIAIWQWSLLPVVLVGVLPSMYGAWLLVFFGVTQHLGLAEDILDHRASTRTVLMNPVFRFLYLDMNYHVEHHIFPAVPYYHLPALHREIAHALPPPTPSTWRAYVEIFESFRAQRFDPLAVVPDRPIPDVASMAESMAGSIAVGSERPDGTDDLGPVDRFAVGSIARVDVADRTYAIARLSETEFCALDGICTHGNAHLGTGDLVDDGAGPQVRCPKHLGRFDARTGAVCSKPLTVPVGAHSTQVVTGHLVVRRVGSPTVDSDVTKRDNQETRV